MTSKEKAKELVDRMYFSRRYKDEENYIPKQAFIYAKQCALIVVDEIISYLKTSEDVMVSIKSIAYWQEVKQEIEKL